MSANKICVVIGASHAGVNFAFSLRKEGWDGQIILYDADPQLPYHRPPLSKAYLASTEDSDQILLKPSESYEREGIQLHLGVRVEAIHRSSKSITLSNGKNQSYDKLVLATGARPFIPPIEGITTAKNLFPMRTAEDANTIRKAFQELERKQVVVIGGGYIGLETAASLKKLGAEVTVLERESRILARVTAPEMSDFFHNLHTEYGVSVLTKQQVVQIERDEEQNEVICADGSRFPANMIIVGAGIRVNTTLAEAAGLVIENGIRVDANTQTNDENIYAIGDCTYHFNPHYGRFIRLESVQNAVDQAKVAAKAICGKDAVYNSIPWFWSDQYDVKLQMVGLSSGYNQLLIRKEVSNGHCFSVWYFHDDQLLAVDAVNYAKAYVLGTRFIKGGQKLNKEKLADPSVIFKPANFVEN